MRKLFLIFALFVTFISEAQIGEFSNVRVLRLINGSSSIAGTIPGTIYYNAVTNKFQFREGSAWVELGSGGTGLTDGDKGDITVTGGTWLVDNAAITLPKLQTIGTSTILGRSSIGTGLVEQLTPAQLNAMLPLATTTLKGLTPSSPGGTTAFLRADFTWATPPGTGGTGTGTTETAGNGLNKVGDQIRLGGSLVEPTTITIPSLSEHFSIINNGNGSGFVSGGLYGLVNGMHLVDGDYSAKVGAYTDFYSDLQGIRSRYENADNTYHQFSLTAFGAYYEDTKVTKTGIEYGGMDGGLSYVTNPGSLTPKVYVDNAIAGAINTGIPNGDKGDITVSNDGATMTIDGDAVTYAKMQNVTGSRILGRITTTLGNTEELTGTQATSMLNNFTRTLKGLTPPSGGTSGTTNFLREDGAWAAPPSGSTPGVFTSVANGLVPASGGGTTKYLRSDATWATFPVIPTFAEGTYTPTASNFAVNVNAVTPGNAEYSRVGNRVTVSGGVYIDTTDGGVGTFTLTLPIASNFTNGMQGSGTVVGWPADGYGTVYSSPDLNLVGIAIRPIDASNRLYYYHYMYVIL